MHHCLRDQRFCKWDDNIDQDERGTIGPTTLEMQSQILPTQIVLVIYPCQKGSYNLKN